MQEKQLHALIIGIDKYQSPVPGLKGAVNDAQNIKAWVEKTYAHLHPNIKLLLDEEATRQNIITAFREHFKAVQPGDAVLIHFSGHGSREKAAAEFKQLFNEGMNETLVCYDSRQEGGLDLADKELAVLLDELAQKGALLTAIFDCCHAGSGTRAMADFFMGSARHTSSRHDPRPLDTYLAGWYTKALATQGTLFIPEPKHVLLAACAPTQKAWETPTHAGAFTTGLLAALEENGPNISTASLFSKCRATVRQTVQNQDPQFDSAGGFDAGLSFIEGKHLPDRSAYVVYQKEGNWIVEAGALQGLSDHPGKPVRFQIFPAQSTASPTPLGHATATAIGIQDSVLQLDFDPGNATEFKARLLSLPIPPTPFYLHGHPEGVALLQAAAKDNYLVSFVTIPEGTAFQVQCEEDKMIAQNSGGHLIKTVMGNTAASATYLLDKVLERIVKWQRGKELQNPQPKLDTSKVAFAVTEQVDDTEWFLHPKGPATLTFRKHDTEWQPTHARFTMTNHTGQDLHACLLIYSPLYGISPVKNVVVAASTAPVTLWGEAPDHYFHLPEGYDEADYAFQLIVSTEHIDDHGFAQDNIEFWVAEDQSAPRKRFLPGDIPMGLTPKVKQDWFTQTIPLKIVRELDTVSTNDLSLTQGNLIIKGHPNLKARVAMSSAVGQGRGMEEAYVPVSVLEQMGIEALQLEGTRSTGATVVELYDIEGDEALAKAPLEIALPHAANENEALMAWTFDGEFILPVGGAGTNANGQPCILIDHLPPTAQPERRSLGKALKMVFSKMVLKKKDTTSLCWVDFQESGEVVRKDQWVKDKVATANNILLLIHGIIGDTQEMAESIPVIAGKDTFDLVMTFDYENLNTPIEETARILKDKLKEVGIGPEDGKQLTLLVHSMGGLVARWMIEREGGNAFVDRLVQAGTPNGGSAFGNIATWTEFLAKAMGIAVNFVGGSLPWIGYVSKVLDGLTIITPTLGQMHKDSDFIKKLNNSDDPGIPYHIVAGDISNYQVDDEQGRIGRLLEKLEVGVGKGVYGSSPNDIAVAVESIHQVIDSRKPAPEKFGAVCHHMNYFVSDAGIKALQALMTSKKVNTL